MDVVPTVLADTKVAADLLNSHSSSECLPSVDSLDKEAQDLEAKADDGGDIDPFLVTWDGDNDPENPQNWPRLRRWFISSIGGIIVLNATFSSAAPSGMLPGLIKGLDMSPEVAILTLSLFLCGYVLGPMFWGPLSEVYGRRPMYLISFTFYIGWQLGSALSPNTTSLLIFRLLAGSFAACPLTNVGAMFGDVWKAEDRGRSMVIFTLAPFAGPVLGPTVGGYLYVHQINWRWVCWIMFFFSCVCMLFIIFFIPETYAPVILKRKAHRLRLQTGDNRYYSPIERHNFSFKEVVIKVIARPMKMLFTEPMLAAATVYMSFNYGCLYLLFEAYPVIFTQEHHLNQGALGLMFVPLFLGGIIASIFFLFYFEPRFLHQQRSPKTARPENRLYMAKWGGPLYVVGFFWLGWTSYPWINYWVPMLSGLVSGCALSWLFVALTNYTIDAYVQVSASVLATQTIVRSLFGVAFPLFAPPMFTVLTPRWACTLLGVFAAFCAGIPFALDRWGPYLRSKSKYSPQDF